MTTSSRVAAVLLLKYGAVLLMLASGAMSSFCQSSLFPGLQGGWAQVPPGGGLPAEKTNPVSSARPGSEVVRRILKPSAKEISYVFALRSWEGEHAGMLNLAG